MHRKLTLLSFIFILTALTGVAAVATAQPSDTILKVRQRFLDADINTLTFHNIDEIFETRKVSTEGHVWDIPMNPVPLDFYFNSFNRF